MNSQKNIVILGINEYNMEKIRSLKGNEEYFFHQLLDFDYVHDFENTPMEEIMNSARHGLNSFEGSIDGLMWLYDFPSCLMGPILCREYGLKGPPEESVFNCENKYLSRIQQQQAIPECAPDFRGFNPSQSDSIEKVDIDYPFWVKPVTAFSGHLGFHVKSDKDFRNALEKIDRKKDLFARPYRYLEEQAELSEEFQQASENIFIAEKIISGKQCTIEGFVYGGEFDFHGIIDSFRYPNRMSFSRYQYPSILPKTIKQRLREKTEKVLRQAGYDNGAFNLEFFWDQNQDKLWLLEINTRISQSHCNLFQKVDGELSHKIPVDIVLDRRPRLPYREGEAKVASKLFLRSFENGTVSRIPPEQTVREIENRFGAEIHLTVYEGMRLDELPWQDSYSYVLAMIYIGGECQKDLLDKFDLCVNELGIEVDDWKIRSKQGRKM